MDARVLEIVEDVVGVGDLDEFRIALLPCGGHSLSLATLPRSPLCSKRQA
jgi:hypothetical protein